MRSHTFLIVAVIPLLFACASSGSEADGDDLPEPYNQLLIGYGASHPGWGDTTERVETLDFVPRHARVLDTVDESWIKGSREFWIELPLSVLLADTDDLDSNDIGIVGLNFLFAWVFPETAIGSPYIMAGGGPVYVLADIEGVGSNLAGNYQFGGGLRIDVAKELQLLLEVRYHHISNLGMKEPNIPLNSTKFLVGFTLPF